MSNNITHANFSRGLLTNLQDGCVPLAFPDYSGYKGSSWDTWEKRIKEGHDKDIKDVSFKSYNWNEAKTDEERENNNKFMSRYENGIIERLTDTMYASLIVSMWATMDNLLKEIKKKIDYIIEEPEKPYRDFGKMKTYFNTQFSIDVEALSDYEIVNAIRILNNSFKHHNGRYMPDMDKPYEQIAEQLLEDWNIKASVEIIYFALPIKELVNACNSFCSDLLTRIRSHETISAILKEVV